MNLSYQLPIDQTIWRPEGADEVSFTWDYGEESIKLLNLYQLGKEKQWDSNERIDWSIEYDPASTRDEPDSSLPLFGSRIFERMTAAERDEYRHHVTAFNQSLFLHGEQGALICASRIVSSTPSLEAKFFAATQVMDEARHVEAFSRLMREKIGLVYPIPGALRSIIEDILSDARADFTQLGMQVLIEGLALAAFTLSRDSTSNSLIKSIMAFVAQDEARHVAFGRLSLSNLYRHELSKRELREREEFVIETCFLMHKKLQGDEVYQRLNIPAVEAADYVDKSPFMAAFRAHLFSRIIPSIKAIGLWTPSVNASFEKIGASSPRRVALKDLLKEDESIAEEVDRARRRQVEATIQEGAQREGLIIPQMNIGDEK